MPVFIEQTAEALVWAGLCSPAGCIDKQHWTLRSVFNCIIWSPLVTLLFPPWWKGRTSVYWYREVRIKKICWGRESRLTLRELWEWYWWISESFKSIALANPVAIAVMLLQLREGGWPVRNGGLSFIQVWLHRPPRKSVDIYDIIVQAGFLSCCGLSCPLFQTFTHAHTYTRLQRRLPAEWIKTACTLWQTSVGPSVCSELWLGTLFLLQ